MNKQLIITFSILLFSLFCFGQKAVRCDGFYQSAVAEIDSLDKDTTWTYFRFYNDGTVISVCTEGTARDIRKWFVRPGKTNNDYNNYTSIGIYQIVGDTIKFTVKSKAATVEYIGTILNDSRLELDEKSLTTEYLGKETYQFVKVKTRKR